VDFASVKGASSWLTALPLQEHGFALHKSAFLDALALRYGWLPLRAPSLCAPVADKTRGVKEACSTSLIRRP